MRGNIESLTEFVLGETSEWVWETGEDHQIIFSNHRLEPFLGSSYEDVSGTNLITILDTLSENGESVNTIRAHMNGHRTFSGISVTLTPGNGDRIVLTLCGDPKFDGTTFQGFVGIGKWVIEQGFQKVCRPNLEKLFTAVEHSPNSILITDRAGIIEYVNPGFESITGYTREEVYGKTPRVLKSGLTERNTYTKMWGDILAGRSWKGTVCNRKKNGEIYWSEETVSPVRDETGHISHFIAIQQDVTERVRTQLELRLSEEKFKDYSEVASDWYWAIDEDYRFTELSDSVASYSGLNMYEMLGRTRFDNISEPEDMEKWQRHLDDLRAKRPFRNFQYTFIRPDGERRLWQISGKPIFDEDGNFKGYRGVGRDVTKQKSLEEQLHQSQKMEVVGQLAGGFAHDFNNLLAIISGNTELMLESLSNGQPIDADKLQKIMEVVDKGTALTQQILAFSRKQMLLPDYTNIGEHITHMQDMLKSSLGEGIDLQIQDNAHDRRCFVDPNQLASAILNAVINARDAMRGTGTLHLRVDVQDVPFPSPYPEVRPGSYIVLSIQDTGDGIEEDHMSKVIEPFFTTKEPGKGTGLGLSMIFGFAKQSGGGITLESSKGVGTTLSIYLPCQPVEEELNWPD
ncbi:hybrid sensor histidine kinase/response regulator [Sneathiella chinensis]|uniref:histidine kinase n=1 Tax=Sneathiella chinensis TaxID=349750 RepID=A0ABQ5U7I6_9PROT|nr:PAS domain-containing sensor histidine kinase [Sneathiella chinensis]GLQ07272.1 hypothetical protein GCM10007924_24930 [Sneathiella chinensis]